MPLSEIEHHEALSIPIRTQNVLIQVISVLIRDEIFIRDSDERVLYLSERNSNSSIGTVLANLGLERMK